MKAAALLLASLISFAAEAAPALSLEAYLQQARGQNLSLAASRAEAEAASSRAQGIRLNAPMVGYMSMREGGATAKGLEVSQEIPFPTKIFQDKEARSLEAEAQLASADYATQQLLAEARSAYVAYWAANERLRIAREKRDWLREHTRLARAASRADSSAQVHFLGVEAEADLQENEVLVAEADLAENRADALAILGKGEEADFVPQEPPLAALEKTRPKKSSFLDWKEKQVAAAAALVSNKKQAYLPDLFLRYRDYGASSMRPANQEIMVGVSLPFLFFWQPRAEVAEASAMRIRAEAELENAKVATHLKIQSLTARAEALREQLEIVKTKLLPRSHRRMRLVDNLSPRSMEGLEDHREAMYSHLDFQQKAVDLRLSYEATVAEIAKIAGSDEVEK